jgi:hypothetical protein
VQPRFELISQPNEELIRELSTSALENPFVTSAYVRGNAQLGFTPCILGVWMGNQIFNGCIGLYKKGRVSGALEIRLLPELEPDSPFWPGLLKACRKRGVWDLTVCSVSCRENSAPLVGPITCKEKGTEFHLHLDGQSYPSCMSSNHRRNLAKSKNSGVVVIRTTSVNAIPVHVSLMGESIGRRRMRGEDVVANIQERYFYEMLATSAGEFFQACNADDGILASVFVLRSPKGGYYQSAGTSPKGMALGASTYLIWTTAAMLQSEGVTCFNLGGATEDNEGLVRFKSGFGATPIPFEITTFDLARPMFRKPRDWILRLGLGQITL